MEQKDLYDEMLKEESLQKCLTKGTRRILVDVLFEYLTEDGPTPKEHEIILVCQAAVNIFKTLMTSPSENGGIVCFATSELRSSHLYLNR